MNLGGEQPGNPGKTIRNTGSSVLIPGGGPASRLQNLSNWLCKDHRPCRSEGMTTINKKLRLVFYALATVELMLVSALYTWGRVAH